MTAIPKISVVVPTYNRRPVVQRAIESLLPQEETDWEAIIVDDASTDDTMDYLQSLTDPRIRVISHRGNLGASGARNVGIDASRANVIAFLDSDDRYLTGRLGGAMAALAAAPELVCTISSAVRFTPKGTRQAPLPAVDLPAAAFEWALITDLFPVETSAITVRRESAVSIGGFKVDVRRTNDREFLIRLSRLGGGRLLPELSWEKYWSDDGLSNQWKKSGSGLLSFVGARPEYAGRFRKMGSYLATKILVRHIRHRHFEMLLRDFLAFRNAGLIDGNLVKLWRDHVDVRRYRRTMSKSDALAALSGPPRDWR